TRPLAVSLRNLSPRRLRRPDERRHEPHGAVPSRWAVSYLLDTSTLLELLRSSPPAPLVRRLSQVPSRDRWTSVITVSQLLLAGRREQSPKLMQDMVRLVAAIRVAPYDLGAAERFAKFRAAIAPEGETDDVMIAAIA